MTRETVERAIRRFVDAGKLAGAAILVWRGGETREVAAVGVRDLNSRAPVERPTIFRIASMSKPVTSVAALSLFEEGRFDLDEPITRWAPEFANTRVLRDADGPLDRTNAARRPITFRDLLTHRSGLTYGDFHRGPIRRAYADTLGSQIDNPLTPDEWIARLATLPFVAQPGERFHYSVSTDLLPAVHAIATA
jgi:CubicO group peptidase (beta-lactamase class C family)